MILVGVVLLGVAAAAALPVFDQEALEWFTRNSSCNERPCTEEEAKVIATVIFGLTGTVGLGLLLAGVGRAIRGRSEGPDLERLGMAGDEGQARRMELLAELDEAYGSGEVGEGEYLRRRRELRE